jgi:centrosomal protein CEP120
MSIEIENYNDEMLNEFNSNSSDKKIDISPIPQSINNNKNYEENVIWDLEVWKRAEQTKFKAYLKQLEFEFLTKLNDEFKHKEDEREKEIKSKINELNVLQTRLKKKALELESRENKINLMEEELKIKMNEIARQLANKEEEIAYYNKRFKDYKIDLEKEKQNLIKQIHDKDREYEKLELNFKNYKKEIDDSPLSVLKNELNRKSLELEDQKRENERLNIEKDKYKQQSEKLKIELIKMKRIFETEKESLYKQKIDEIEKLKFEIYTQKISQNEVNEIQELKAKIKQLTEVPEKQKKEYKVVNIKRNVRGSDTKSELEKLKFEKMSLLNSGMYKENDPLIIQIDNRIRKLIDSEDYI